jgi:ketosteroid isomerase-like protein
VLPADPRLGAGVVVAVDGEREEVLGVVAPGEVAQDGVALEDGEVAVVVVEEGRDAAVGVDGGEPGLLLDVG